MKGRLSRWAACRVVKEWLVAQYGMVPEFTMMKDGKGAWAWFINPGDTTSYVHADGTVEWYGSSFGEGKGGAP